MGSPFLHSLLLLAFLFGHQFFSGVVLVHATEHVYIVYMGERHHNDPSAVVDLHHDMLGAVLGSKEAAAESIIYNYKHGFSGFAAKLTESQAMELAAHPSVTHVLPNQMYKLHTTRSWDYLGLSFPSPGNNLLNLSNMGEDIIIGILDTGIWPESKSFSDKGLGPIPSRWRGKCQTGQNFSRTNCNKKLIGARYYIKGLLSQLGEPFNTTEYMEYISPRDAVGHGTHVSSTAAGAMIRNANYIGLGLGVARGGATRARLAMYKVCWAEGSCTYADVLKAFDDAIYDGVDVLSLSLGYPRPSFFDVDKDNAIAIGSFHAVRRGISVICSAGNGGPRSRTVLNTAPWIITVAASTIDRAFPTTIFLGNNQTLLGQGMFRSRKGIGFTGLYVYKGVGLDSDSSGLCEALPTDDHSMRGKVTLCFAESQFEASFASYILNMTKGAAVIVAADPNSLIIRPCDDVPCVYVSKEVGSQILSYIRSSRNPVVKINPSVTLVGKPVPIKIARFSSRGPSYVSPEVLKPDVAAPGVNILASVPPYDQQQKEGEFEFKSGTSMSAPHVAGIVALLRSLHPDWSPASIRSALTTTASTTDAFGEPIMAEGSPTKLADPFDYGGGIVNPNQAADPGLVYDMTPSDYIHYLCSMGYSNSDISRLAKNQTRCPIPQPSLLDINLPSIMIPRLKTNASVTVHRTLMNVGPAGSVYNVSLEAPLGVQVSVMPAALTFDSSYQKQSFAVMVATTHKVEDGYFCGSFTWSSSLHAVRSPICVETEVIRSYSSFS